MISANLVAKLLKKSGSPVIGDFELNRTGEDSFHLVSDGAQYAVKVLPRGVLYGENEVRFNRDVLAGIVDPPAPKVRFIAEDQERYVVLWNWVQDNNLGHQGREFLPAAFERLGDFHRLQRNSRPVHSLYAMRDFSSIGEMIDAEIEAHCRHFDQGYMIKGKVLPRLRVLEKGYPTLCHGDMHPSNIIWDGGNAYFIDWANGHNGLSLMDLDRVHSIELSVAGDYKDIINPAESKRVLDAYFRAAGLGDLDSCDVHYAVMLLNQLRLHSYGVEDQYELRSETAKRNIDILLSFER